jgi:serine/threonine protein phosphatase PrpC
MNANGAFVIGQTHDVCQDYASAGILREGAFAVVADGCSSSPDTDVGARLLVKAAELLVEKLDTRSDDAVEWYHATAVGQAFAHADVLGVDPRCVDATLLTIRAHGRRFIATCFGDGAIVLKDHSGDITVYSVTFAESYPRYPSYFADARRLAALDARTENVKEVIRTRLTPDGRMLSRETSTSHRAIEIVSGSIDEFTLVAVMSDGVNSFTTAVASETSRRSERLGLEKVLPELVAFKSPTGAFVQRRLNRFRVECHRRGWNHLDDLAIAAIHLGS